MRTFWKISIVAALTWMGCEKPVDSDCKGVPQVDCNCYMVYDPVCGCDGVTYGNDCQAHCAGVKSWTPGECGE